MFEMESLKLCLFERGVNLSSSIAGILQHEQFQLTKRLRLNYSYGSPT